MAFIAGIFVLMSALTLGVLCWERRALFAGALTMVWYGCLCWLLIAIASTNETNALWLIPVLIFAVGPVIAVALTPLALTVVSIYSGVRLILREGFSLTNSLALALGAALLLWPLLPNANVQIPGIGPVWQIVYGYIFCIIVYFSLYAVVYTVTALINLVPARGPVDYVVVLGSGLMGDKVTPLLAARVDRGIAVYRKSPGSRLMMTGGQGDDEEVAEGVAMARYAMERGVPEADIIIEDRALNTRQNLSYSWALMDGAPVTGGTVPRVVVATTSYHVLRALLLARSLGLKCSGAGARTKLYFAFNAFIREFIGYLSLARKQHAIVLAICTVLYAAVMIYGTYVMMQAGA
ncbi:MAG: YdcF family protein [Rothia sp. (in: high G+C Gram-positive bacteria)]|uniref:YdcF family protein n=1 Tax=Rothia sp. (in: high G+C Gram-positive bacteria) TaxID=1885016 RepID=UPI0026DEAD5F|nr:YdcF family protein [Rothia sp. (in: high G+C Gram-positive bacteria)]MDO5750515.1 YdcF family protein [Rothia sp. (in: high G+C Gram-positive bacteria)]